VAEEVVVEVVIVVAVAAVEAVAVVEVAAVAVVVAGAVVAVFAVYKKIQLVKSGNSELWCQKQLLLHLLENSRQVLMLLKIIFYKK
jgi:phage-related minor tail protein